MQNRYVGDIGDFGKYGLLRALTGPTPPLRLGVVWYLFPDESNSGDGRLTGFLSKSDHNYQRFCTCDPTLYENLRHLVSRGQRDVASVQRMGILPADTLYYECSLSYPRHMKRPERQTLRESWIKGALKTTESADLIFLDPDNGIAGKTSPWRKKGPKYVFMDDLERFYTRGQSLIVYHHLGRHKPANDQIGSLSESIRHCLKLSRPPIPLRYRRGTSRVYFIIPQEKHCANLQGRIESFLQTPWNKHFELADGCRVHSHPCPTC